MREFETIMRCDVKYTLLFPIHSSFDCISNSKSNPESSDNLFGLPAMFKMLIEN